MPDVTNSRHHNNKPASESAGGDECCFARDAGVAALFDFVLHGRRRARRSASVRMPSSELATVRFERPRCVTFRLVKGPVPHVVERYELRASGSGTAFEYRDELSTDLWALGAWWGAVVAPSWERTVASSLDGIRTEAERRARRRP